MLGLFAGVVVWHTTEWAPLIRATLAVAFTVSGVFAWRFSGLGWRHPIVLVFGFLLAIYLFTPEVIVVEAGAGDLNFRRWIAERMLVYLHVAMALLAGAALVMARDQTLFRGFRMFVVGIGCLSVVAGSTLKTVTLGDLDADFAELLSGAEAVAPGSTVLLLRVIRPGDDITAVESETLAFQAGGYYTVLRNTIDVRLVQAAANTAPIKFARGRNVYEKWVADRDMAVGLPMLEFESFERVMGYPLDYVIVWGRLDQFEDGRKQAFLRRLTPYYQQVFRSRETGRLRVFQRIGMAGES